MAVTLAEICDGIEATLGTAPSVKSSTSYDELTSGVASTDCPRLEVYPDSGTCDPSGTTDRMTFNACRQQCVLVVYADLYAMQRGNLVDAMRITVEMIDELIDVLQTQEKPPFFGVAGIKAFNWSWRRFTPRRGNTLFMGARFTINVKIY